jgi:hypothetical protein
VPDGMGFNFCVEDFNFCFQLFYVLTVIFNHAGKFYGQRYD